MPATPRTRYLARTLSLAAGATTVLASPAIAQFVEPNVRVIHEWTGGHAYAYDIARLEDIDGDGVREAIVALPYAQGAFRQEIGAVEVRSGATGDLIMTLSTGVRGDDFGVSVDDAGDVNGDGYHDVVVGASRFDGERGAAYIYSGHPDSRGQLITRIDGPYPTGRFGRIVAGIGDTNGDGLDEIAVGAPFAADAPTLPRIGKAYVVSVVAGDILIEFRGAIADSEFGDGIGRVGDLDGDSVDEIAIGAPLAKQVNVYSPVDGRRILARLESDEFVFVFGRKHVGAAGDVNADGVPDVLVGNQTSRTNCGRVMVFSGVDGSVLLSRHGCEDGIGEGFGQAAAAGDLDGDGYDDIISGVFRDSQAAIMSGRDGSLDRIITDANSESWFGREAIVLDDADGDGAPDYLIAASRGAGSKAYVIAGLCRADLDRDGRLTIIDFLGFQSFFDIGDLRADFDRDGVLTVFDFLEFSNVFQQCSS